MKIKTPFIILAICLAFLASSCNRYITPTEAANGKARCNRGLR
ncbi:hypothetical protein [Niastella sp. OAS944]|nr:hypothetical protein [Chitinophagaceae bacterium OAS944]